MDVQTTKQDPIKFKYVALQMPLPAMLANNGLCKVTQRLLNVAFDHGGYIAGGFGTLLARHLVLGQGDLEQIMRSHLLSPIPVPDNHPRPWIHNARAGDIDVWFPSDEALSAFLVDERYASVLALKNVICKETPSGCALEHLITGDARVQVVTRFLMPLEEQLSRFDIYNAMVAVTPTHVIVPEHWRLLELKQMLHVSTWKAPWTVNRFFKWIEHKGYSSVTPVTADAVLNEAISALNWFARHHEDLTKDELDKEIQKSRLLRRIASAPDKVQMFLRPIMTALPAERLLEMTAFFKSGRYDIAMQEIRRRIPVD